MRIGQITRFRTKVLLSIIPMILALCVLFGGMSLYQHNRLLHSEFVKRGKALASNLAASGELGVFSEDERLLNAALRGITGEEDVAYVFIYNDAGKRLIGGGKALTQPGLGPTTETLNHEIRAQMLTDHQPASRTVKETGAESFLEFYAPIVSAEVRLVEEQYFGMPRSTPGLSEDRSRVIGIARVGLSMRNIDAHSAYLIKLWAILSVVFLAGGALAAYALSRRITQPITRLTESTARMAEGQIDQEISVDSLDELGTLATTYNKMAKALTYTLDERARVARELRDLNRSLEDRIRERTSQLEETNRDLSRASRHKSEFLANMSHELRTPLNAILGFTDLIIDGIYGQVPNELRESMEDIRINGRHLLRLINDVLDLSKIEAGQMRLNLGEYSLQSLIDSVISATRSLATEKRLELVARVEADLPPALGDSKRMTQVLMNLVGNAIKFTPGGGSVNVTAKSVSSSEFQVSSSQPETRNPKPETPTSPDFIEISVADTGIGIPAEELKSIFGEFRQVDSSITREYGGSGLGLSIAKRLVEMHRGSIWADSQVGRGSTFYVRIPLRTQWEGSL
ncbi:MAG: HAMP domain-containing protein [Candidatus Methylomirabilis oxygeniifera]|uniref:histidine kinase n=1 Tax=Methylomirabilis oxygeniifera TaxID=671143 RepID=D5MK44_METO1|nr:MAG: HAMP domain-containing protein [Candidatus Methylomirabilis oxyfera]CBE69666.1 putative Histidine kinase [Candidatus Methylomirabilis oxyfera]